MYVFPTFFGISLLLVLLSFQSVLFGVKGQYEELHKVGCSAQYCIDKMIECNAPPNCTTVGFRKFLNPQICNCCQYCYDYLNETASCKTLSTTLPKDMCGPLLQCEENEDSEQKCVPMTRGPDDIEKGCIGAYNDHLKRVETGKDGILDFEPDCDAHGNYVPRQCLPGSSICICMNAAGEKIFGAGLIREVMDCACARDVDRLKSFGFTGNFPHCLPNGDYDELQCSLHSRSCYCRKTPGPDGTVAMKNLDKLPCYDKSIHPLTYNRWCEVERAEKRILLVDAAVQNTTILVADIPICDPDGHYHAVQSRNQKWICVDPNGEQIESFEAAKTVGKPEVPAEMDCRCARMRYHMGESAAGKPKCCRNGTYRPWQCVGSTCFCVTKIGQQDMNFSPAEVHQDEVSKLGCYVEAC